MNRIQAAIERVQIKAKGVGAERLIKLNRTLDMELDEYCQFQNLKSVAVLHGWLTLDEANYVYGLLGNTVEHFNSQPVAVKSVLTQLFGQLLGKQIHAMSVTA